LLPPQSQTYWKSFSQHTLQFTLIDQLVQAKVFNKPASFESLMSVWDTLGLLGPAAAAGIVSEQESKLFLKDVFDTIRADWKKPMTDRLIGTLIPNLFGGQSIIHPVVAEKPMPPAEAQVVNRILPAPVINNPESTPPVAVAPVAPPPPGPAAAPGAPKTDKKMDDIKAACRKLLEPGGGRRRTRKKRRVVTQRARKSVRQTRSRKVTQPMKGGGIVGSGEHVIVLGGDDWSFLPLVGDDTPANPRQLNDTVVVPLLRMGLTPADVVAYIGDVAEKHLDAKDELVRAVAETSPYIKIMTNTYLLKYTPNKEDVDRKVIINGNLPARFDDDASELDVCLVTRRYDHTIWSDRDDPSFVLSIADIMIGLVHINGAFVQGDLHLDNMCIMRDGCPVIADYGRVCGGGSGEFTAFLTRMKQLDSEGAYAGIDHYDSVTDFISKKGPEKSMEDQVKFSKIFDLLCLIDKIETSLPVFNTITTILRQFLFKNWQIISQSDLHKWVTALNQRIVEKVTGKDWKAMTMDEERAMANEYLKHAGPARNNAGLWKSIRNHYRFGVTS